MWGVVAFLCGVGFGTIGWFAVVVVSRPPGPPGPPRRALPPATARQIKRARRANRIEVRHPPRWIAAANHDFDTEDTVA